MIQHLIQLERRRHSRRELRQHLERRRVIRHLIQPEPRRHSRRELQHQELRQNLERWQVRQQGNQGHQERQGLQRGLPQLVVLHFQLRPQKSGWRVLLLEQRERKPKLAQAWSAHTEICLLHRQSMAQSIQ